MVRALRRICAKAGMNMRHHTNIGPEDIIELLIGAVPERTQEIKDLWARYNPKIFLARDARRLTLDANKERIRFDAKTMDVFWLIGFAGWKAIECYGPVVTVSATTGQPLSLVIIDDKGLGEIERDYKERRAAAQSLIDALDPADAPWPDDIPRPEPNRDAFNSPEFKVAFDLTCLAVAFTFLHEFRHVMLDRDCQRPSDLREEEMLCDVWARDFMTSNLAKYASQHGHNYADVLRKRAMGLALSALIVHEITPSLDHGGNRSYFSTRDRLHAILNNTKLPNEDHFWVFAASLLVGIYRQRGEALNTDPMNAKSLALHLLREL
ncbi:MULTISPECIES: phage exclusion protein Lit family protein [Alphaproteobacteria]|uniref:phage exclusion protein Lit family protein n=1 Tax=Alphaproteobacteria TaxID=28211 RepID=UPI00329A69C4